MKARHPLLRRTNRWLNSGESRTAVQEESLEVAFRTSEHGNPNNPTALIWLISRSGKIATGQGHLCTVFSHSTEFIGFMDRVDMRMISRHQSYILNILIVSKPWTLSP
ncbi:MAG: hypothetical protein QOF90_3801, partial [Acetobacteraceae bacterium]|nr:hypothetical protein [Acetobacteraceae bacterium]